MMISYLFEKVLLKCLMLNGKINLNAKSVYPVIPFIKSFSKFVIVFLLFKLNSFTKFASIPLEIFNVLFAITLKKSPNLS